MSKHIATAGLSLLLLAATLIGPAAAGQNPTVSASNDCDGYAGCGNYDGWSPKPTRRAPATR